jgi:hypothetical protein
MNDDDNDDGVKLPHARAAAGSKRKRLLRMAGRRNLSSGQEEAFLNMQLRKMNRAMSGTKRRDMKYEYAALLLVLVLIFSGHSLQWFWKEDEDGEEDEAVEKEEGDDDNYIVKLTFGQMIILAMWLFWAIVVTSVFKESHFIALLYLMMVYIPLIFWVTSAVFGDDNVFALWGPVLVTITEVLALAIFIFVYYLFPRIINSGWFRRKGRAVWYFRVNLITDWTMSYTRRSSRFGLGYRHTCKYEGETNDVGQPHGIGRWFDDAYEGEILTGAWENGNPVAPFSSRIYGTGDAFRAVLVPYFKASDDGFHSTKLWPTNESPVECGVASVECSVSGAFYNELPEAKHFIDSHPFNPNVSIRKMYASLRVIQQKVDIQSLAIMADDPRGIQIEGHVYATTGRAFQQVDEILIKVKREETRPLLCPNLPMISSVAVNERRLSFFGLEKLFIHEVESVSLDDESAPTAQSPNDHSQDNNDELARVEGGRTSTLPQFSLEVDGWMKSEKKDVLIFFPGFNSSLKNSLENFGQLLAMTKLDSRVYPILFNWPAGQVMTYLSASRAALSERNCENFRRLLNGLHHEGFRNVHLMSHSMGVQTLLGALIDKEDGSRSDSSRCFALASDYDIPNENDEVSDESKLLICKTITLLNPDFPLVPFREHAFSAARKLCRTITVVGDKLDNALFWSQVVNGVAVRSGHEQPYALLPNDACKKKLQHLRTVGRCVESLFFPDDVASRRGIGEHDYRIFKDKAPLVLHYDKKKAAEKSWMDLDVIDTTGLDTNMKKIRHSAFNLNANLFNDLDELITTGKRAMDRSLLYRDGNVFSYCSAPSFVNM